MCCRSEFVCIDRYVTLLCLNVIRIYYSLYQCNVFVYLFISKSCHGLCTMRITLLSHSLTKSVLEKFFNSSRRWPKPIFFRTKLHTPPGTSCLSSNLSWYLTWSGADGNKSRRENRGTVLSLESRFHRFPPMFPMGWSLILIHPFL